MTNPHRNFGLSPSSQGTKLTGPTSEAQSFIREERDFIAGLFSGIVLAVPFLIVGVIYLAFVY